jgi:FlaA1/EpsC-like NDP-sugar epimerase
MALVFSLVNSWLGLGRVLWRSARPAHVYDLALSSGISTVLVASAAWLWPARHLLPPGMVLVSGLLAFLGFVAVRYRERLLTGLASRWLSRRGKRRGIGERVLIVGAGECAQLASWLFLRSRLSPAFSIVGMVDDDPAKTGMTVDGHHVFGLTRRIPEIVKQQDVGVILFAIETIQPEEEKRILRLCEQTPARLVQMPDLLAIFRERLKPPLPRGEGGGEGKLP